MKAIAEIQVVPLGVGVSARKVVARAFELIAASGLRAELHAMGTNVEGDLAAILDTVQRLHEVLHKEKVPRLSTSLKLSTRTDKEPTLEARLL